jgi:nicotinate-nucleotide adenylyltransferase
MKIMIGGSFDPVHEGHLMLAQSLESSFPDATFLFTPCSPSEKEKSLHATPQQRIDMLKIAIHKHVNWEIDLRELKQNKASNTPETLQSLRIEYPFESIAFVMGTDVFMQLHSWDQWDTMLNHAHLIIVQRPGSEMNFQGLPSDVKSFYEKNRTGQTEHLALNQAGSIFLLETNMPELSSTMIRTAIKHKHPITGLPQGVIDYIYQHQLYYS